MLTQQYSRLFLKAYWVVIAIKLLCQTLPIHPASLPFSLVLAILVGIALTMIEAAERPSLAVRATGALSLIVLMDLIMAYQDDRFLLTPLVISVMVLAAGALRQRGAVIAVMLISDAMVAVFCVIWPQCAFSVLSPRQVIYLMSAVNACAILTCVIVQWVNSQIKRSEQTAYEADLAAMAKSSFLANASHEIRTPMNAIFGMNELILSAPEGTDMQEIKEKAAYIKAAGTELLDLINDILDISKIEQGEMRMVEQPYDGEALFADIQQRIEAAYPDTALRFRITMDFSVSNGMVGDDMRIRHVTMKMLNNAFKFTSEGSVSLSVSQVATAQGLDLVISVEDTGKGLNADTISKILKGGEKFYVKENSSSSGMGLGMAITMKLLQMMNGTIKIDSVPGQGAKFTARIPQRIAHIDRDERAIKNAGQLRIDGAKVLGVDDNPINQKVAKGLLKQYGINMDMAGSGEEAIEKLKYTHYDLIFMDHMMPGMDGVETTKKIRKMEGGDKLKIVSLSANSDPSAERFFKDNGMTDAISKPVIALELERVLRTYLAAFVRPGGFVTRVDFADPSFRLPGVDVRRGIANCGGTLASYKALLNTLTEDGVRQVRRLQMSFNNQDHAGVEREAGTIKEISRKIGMMELGEMMEELEEQAEAGDRAAMSRSIGPVLSELRRMLELVSQVLNVSLPESLPEKPVMPREEMAEKLRDIRRFSEEYMLDEASALIDELIGSAGNFDVEHMLYEIKTGIMQFSYQGTIDKTDALLKRLTGGGGQT